MPPWAAIYMEYGFSCMGYEIAGALGIKMARPDADVVCMLGDGSYMMANSELATAVAMGLAFTVVLTDKSGFGCINRLQKATVAHLSTTCWPTMPGGGCADRLCRACRKHGRAGASVGSITELESALRAAKGLIFRW